MVNFNLYYTSMQTLTRTKQQCLPPLQQSPWLLYFKTENGKRKQIFCSISDPTVTYTRSIPELRDSNLWTVQHGWCLLSNQKNGYELFLWNPCTLQKIELPHLAHGNVISDYILSSSPTAIDQVCSIFLFSWHTASIFYCQLGDDQWTEVDYREELEFALAMKGKKVPLIRYKSYLTNPVYCDGCVYAETFGSFLVVIEIKHGYRGLKINPTLVLMPTLPSTKLRRIRRLLESNNELFQIEIFHIRDKVISVVVYKFEFSLLVWEKVKSVKDTMFFISYVDSHTSFACQANNSETEGGRIYFTLHNKNFVYIYNVEENSITFSQPFSDLPETPSHLMWFMPDLRMKADILREERGKSKSREKENICGAIHLKEKGTINTNESALLLDVVDVIADRLNVFDYLHLRATSRLFRLGAPPFQLNAMSGLGLRFDDHSLCSLLVFLDKDNVLTFVHPKHGLKYKYTIKLPKVNFLGGNANDYDDDDEDEYLINSDCEICYSKDGWLLLTMNKNCSYFFNPFRKEVIPFEYGPIIRSAKCVGFTHCPKSYKCVIVDFDEGYTFDNKKTSIFRVIDNLTLYDFDISFSFQHDYFSLYNKSPTFHNGLFYYLSNNGMLGVIKFREEDDEDEEEERARWIEIKDLQSPCTDSINSFLLECNGKQLSVFEGPFGKWVRVFELNESTGAWIKVESLGNHMLFVGNTSFSAVANIPGMENKIYFPRFYDQSIVFYSLETKKYHTFENEVVNFESVREPLNCSWIEPRWH